MSDTGAVYAGTAANDASAGTTAWTNASNATADDGSSASISTGSNSQYLKATNFGLTVPSGATIDGIQLEVKWVRTTSTYQQVVSSVKGGTIGGTNKSTGSILPAPVAYTTFGGAADLWGQAWTDSDVNASNFGFVVKVFNGGKGTAIGSVDAFRVTVYYTGGSSGTAKQSVIVRQAVNRSYTY